jgi:hypothetical protein
MDVVSTCPLRVSARVWPSAHGWGMTVVCKAVYRLLPGESELDAHQEAPNEEDSHWDDDPRRSLSSASDLVPFKARPEVLLVGSAFAPGGRPARSIVTRLVVAEVDKSIEAFCDRAFRQTGELVEGLRVAQVPLRYERAGGGPGTWNPVGVRHDADPDAYGMVALPNLQPPATHVAYRGTFVEPVGYGPIAPSWPARAQRVGPNAAGFLPARWHQRPLPPGFDPAFFNAAPPDQQVSELRSNERIVLENLHRDHPRLVTSLPGIRPAAVAERAGGQRERVTLTADTLAIDTGRGTCAMVWRGWIRLSHPEEAGRVVFSIDAPAFRAPAPAAVTAPQPRVVGGSTWPASPQAGRGPATPFGGATEAPVDTKSTLPAIPFAGKARAMPFVSPPAGADASPSALFRSPWPSSPGIAEPAPAPLRPHPSAGSTLTDASPPVGDLLPFRSDEPPDSEPTTRAAHPSLPSVPELVPMLARAPALAYEPVPPVEARPPSPPPPVVEAPPEPAPPGDVEPAGAEPAAPPAPPREPEPGDFPIERCAALTAAIAMDRPGAEALLTSEGLAQDRWAAIAKHWDDAIRDERARGRTALLKAFDAAYVASIEERRGPVQVEEYARLVVGAERGSAAGVAADLGLPKGAPMRIERVWAARMVKDPALARRVRAAIAAERER